MFTDNDKRVLRAEQMNPTSSEAGNSCLTPKKKKRRAHVCSKSAEPSPTGVALSDLAISLETR